MSEPIRMTLRGLTKEFGGVTAVDHVDLEHDAGGVLGLIGPNGAGKTTLFNMLSGALAPSAGTIELDGHDVTGLRPDLMNRAGVARTFQNLQVFGSLSVLDNVMVARERHVRGGVWRALFGLAAVGRTEAEQREYAVRLLQRVGLEGLADEEAANLPYGLQRRVEVARALASEPRLLLLDEPLAGLSRAESADLGQLFRDVAAEGVTVLLVEHDVSTVMTVSDRVVVLDHGTLLADGPAAQVQADPRVRAAYLGEEMPT
jgi:ABC-type branched-subunit amino acid transport system ATPase component